MNREELNEKIAEVSKTVFSYSLSKTSSREDAEDLSQEILYELVKSSENLRDVRAFYGFMWAIADNVYKQWYRKKTASQTCELNENLVSQTDEYDLDENNEIYLLRRELSLLAEKYRKATIMYYVDKKSCAEIARQLAITESMAKYLLFKSRKKLKEGMNMERKLGELSYNPKEIAPLYNGSGPNHFWEFMQSKVRQNILNACYNDSLKAEQISLEIGIPLPYLDDDIKALTEKRLLIKDGNHYKTNVIIISAECNEEIRRSVTPYHNRIADEISVFLEKRLDDFKKIGFIGNDYSENTLRWQMAAFVFVAIAMHNTDILKKNNASELPKTAWGDNAYLWLIEKGEHLNNWLFNFSQENDREGNRIHFCDYVPSPKGDHHDFYRKARHVGILCNIALGKCDNFNEYDLEVIAEMIKNGYVLNTPDGYKATTPVFTSEQYQKAITLITDFVDDKIDAYIREMDSISAKILSEHTPKHLQDQVDGIASMDKFVNAACIPAKILIERKVLHTDWNALEMPTTFIVLK